jgi:hypothetical protein
MNPAAMGEVSGNATRDAAGYMALILSKIASAPISLA